MLRARIKLAEPCPQDLVEPDRVLNVQPVSSMQRLGKSR